MVILFYLIFDFCMQKHESGRGNSLPYPIRARFVIPSDLRDDVRYVGFVERRERKTLLSEMVERCAYVD